MNSEQTDCLMNAFALSKVEARKDPNSPNPHHGLNTLVLYTSTEKHNNSTDIRAGQLVSVPLTFSNKHNNIYPMDEQ